MEIHLKNNFMTYEYDKFDCLKYVELSCNDIKQALRLVEMTNEHLIVRCPLSGEYLEVTGTMEELQWVNSKLFDRGWYRLK